MSNDESDIIERNVYDTSHLEKSKRKKYKSNAYDDIENWPT